jgi:O-antigen/teichoic acid export membrane protein
MSLRANFSWTFVGNVVYAGSQWGMLTALAKLGSPEMVGQFALGLTVTAPVVMFTNLNLRAVQATDAKHEYLFGDYLGLRLLTSVLALLAIAGIAFASGYEWETALVILAVGVAKAVESVSDVFYGMLQQREWMDRIAKSMMIKGILSLASLSIIVYLTGSVFWGVIGLVFAWTLILIGYDLRSGLLILGVSPQLEGRGHDEDGQAETVRPSFKVRTLTRLAWFALPLGVVMMLVSLRTNIPRYLVERFLGEYELGIYAAVAYVIVAGNTVVHALGGAASPRLAQYYAAGDGRAFRKLLLRLVGIGVALGSAGILLALVGGEQILSLLYKPEYARQDLLVLLMIAGAISYVAAFLTRAMTAARYLWVQMPLYVLTISVLTLACWWLMPLYGLNGAAMALIIAVAVLAGGSVLVVLRALRTIAETSPSGRSDQEEVYRTP